MRYFPTVSAIIVTLSIAAASALAQETQPRNLLLNGEAEQGKDNQPSIWFEASVRAEGLKMQQDKSVAYHGKASLLIENTHKYKESVANNWGQSLQEVPVGKTLLLKAAIKTSDVESANVCIQCWDASGEKMLAFGSTPVVRGDQDWTVFKSDPITVPAQTKSIIVRAALGGTGKVWFDDLMVIESSEPATVPVAQAPANERPTALEQLVGGRILAQMPIDRDQMVLAYIPDWAHGNVDNIAVANNDGGVRTFFRWPKIDPKYQGKRFVLAAYSRETKNGENPSEVQAYEVTGEWDEQTPWTKQPKVSEKPAAIFDLVPGRGWKTFDLTTLVQAQMKQGGSNGAMMRFAREDANPGNWSGYAFVSREAEGGWEDRRPVLLVVE